MSSGLAWSTSRRRNSARWAIALALALQQGSALGLQWLDIDLDKGTMRVVDGSGRSTSTAAEIRGAASLATVHSAAISGRRPAA